MIPVNLKHSVSLFQIGFFILHLLLVGRSRKRCRLKNAFDWNKRNAKAKSTPRAMKNTLLKIYRTFAEQSLAKVRVVAFFWGGLISSIHAQGIEFVERTGAENPLNAVVMSSGLTSESVDIDADGDLDLFVGNQEGTIRYYKNIGTEAAPNVFEEQQEIDPVFQGFDVGSHSVPTFVDIDNDQHLDLFVGGMNGIAFLKNKGTDATPVFEEQDSINNPLSFVTHAGNRGFFPTFVDIDLDGDTDVFIGWVDYDLSGSSGIDYFRNDGTGTSPNFVRQEGADNPFASFDKLYPKLIFVNADTDEDLDVFIPLGDGSFSYYENISDFSDMGMSQNALQAFVLYPNPALDRFTVVLKSKTMRLRMHSLSGREVLNCVLTEDAPHVSVKAYPAGIYVLLLDDGVHKYSQKLVIVK